MKYIPSLMAANSPSDDIIVPILLSLFICEVAAFFLLNLISDKKYSNIVRVIQGIIIFGILAVGLMIIIMI